MAARLASLRDDRIDAARLEPARLGDRRRARQNQGAGLSDAIDQPHVRQAEMEADDRRLLAFHDLAHRRVERAPAGARRNGGGIEARLGVVRRKRGAPTLLGARIRAGRHVELAELAAAARAKGRSLATTGRSNGTPRSVAFNVQAFRIAVNKRTGAIKILRSIHAADAGRVINPMQCRGQIEGGVAQSLGAALYEEMVIDDTGRVANPTFRNYHLPQFGDVPRTEVLFADTSDSIGPFGAKSMSESPYNPINAAIGNALADATGIRFCQTPFKPDRIFRAIADKFGTSL